MSILDDSKATNKFYTLYTEYNHLDGDNRSKKFLELCIHSYKTGGLKLLNAILDKELTGQHNIIRAVVIAKSVS